MPTYDFRCKSCGKMYERFCKISERETILPECPECGGPTEQLILGATPIGDAVRLGIRTIDDGFRELLSGIHEKTYKSNLNEKLSRN